MVDRASAHGVLDRLTSEKDFMQQVIDLARLCNWLVYHTHSSLKSEPGFPDLILAKPGQPILAWELKRVGGKATEAQQHWIDTLAQATGVHAAVLWPCSQHREYIEQTLKGG